MGDPQPTAEPVLLFEHVSKWYGPVIGAQPGDARTARRHHRAGRGERGRQVHAAAPGDRRNSSRRSGRVTVRGHRRLGLARQGRLVGYCPDADAFYEDMSGRRVRAGRWPGCAATPRAEAGRRTEAVLERVGMADRADRKLARLLEGHAAADQAGPGAAPRPRAADPRRAALAASTRSAGRSCSTCSGLAGQGKCLLISSHELEELEKLTEPRGDHGPRADRGGRHAAADPRPAGRPPAVGADRRGPPPRPGAPAAGRPPEVRGRRLSERAAATAGAGGEGPQPRRFFEAFGRLVVEEQLDVRRLEPLDESAHAILGYLLGGSGKT